MWKIGDALALARLLGGLLVFLRFDQASLLLWGFSRGFEFLILYCCSFISPQASHRRLFEPYDGFRRDLCRRF